MAAYIPAQIAGAIGGAVLANAMFAEPLVKWSAHDRSAGHLWLGEIVATAGLILLVFGLARTDRAALAPVAVASYIGAAYWFTSSTSFANPAVTIGRAFSDTFAGIAPASVAPFSLPNWSVPLSAWAWWLRCSADRLPTETDVAVPHGETELATPFAR